MRVLSRRTRRSFVVIACVCPKILTNLYAVRQRYHQVTSSWSHVSSRPRASILDCEKQHVLSWSAETWARLENSELTPSQVWHV